MRPILLDTNAYTAFMLGDAAVVQVVAHAERLCLNSVDARWAVGLRCAS